MTHNQLDNLMPEVLRRGIAAALTLAQQEGLIRFPGGRLTREAIEYRLEQVIGAFVAEVKVVESEHKDK